MADIDTAENKIQDILKEYKLKMGYDILFPIYNQLPDEVKLALAVLSRHHMKIIFTLKAQDEL